MIKETEKMSAEELLELVKKDSRYWNILDDLQKEMNLRKQLENVGKRSEPGKGEIVNIFVLEDRETNFEGGPENWDISGPSLGEDFAEDTFPVVIKLERRVTTKMLINAILQFLSFLNNQYSEKNWNKF